MSTPTPARPADCTLSDAELGDRRLVWQRLSTDIVAVVPVETGFAVRYRATPMVTEHLGGLAAAESSCCGFAAWKVREDGDVRVLTVTGPSPGIDQLHALFHAG